MFILQEAKCGYAIILMALYWCTECIPLAVTALLPVVLFPMMGIMKAGDVRYPLEFVTFQYTGMKMCQYMDGEIVHRSFYQLKLH